LAAFENPQALVPQGFPKPAITRREFPSETLDASEASGLWIHEEDLAVETSSLAQRSFPAIAVTADLENWERYQFPSAKRQWISAALEDAATRARAAWKAPTSLEIGVPHAAALLSWAQSNKLRQIVALRPDVGPLDDSLPALRTALAVEGIGLVLVDRPEDLRLRPFATGGFFPFWEAVRKCHIAPIPEDASLAK